MNEDENGRRFFRNNCHHLFFLVKTIRRHFIWKEIIKSKKNLILKELFRKFWYKNQFWMTYKTLLGKVRFVLSTEILIINKWDGQTNDEPICSIFVTYLYTNFFFSSINLLVLYLFIFYNIFAYRFVVALVFVYKVLCFEISTLSRFLIVVL